LTKDADHTLDRPHKFFALVKECYPHCFHGTDKVWNALATAFAAPFLFRVQGGAAHFGRALFSPSLRPFSPFLIPRLLNTPSPPGR
jgi:hypothetical protein